MVEAPDFKISPDNAVEAGHKMTITFAPQSATQAGDVVQAGCQGLTSCSRPTM
jgi:hypothetical protein